MQSKDAAQAGLLSLVLAWCAGPLWPEDTVPALAAAAREVVERYYAALDRRDYETAYRLWSDDGRASQQSFEAFEAGFAETARVSVTADAPRDVEGAAGSIFATVPVQISATLADGTEQHFFGDYVLRRVNDVPGATTEELNWHIHSADIRDAP